ncbi:MAG: hypothetical protein P8183_15345, partial [Anaerolineae bacterium]
PLAEARQEYERRIKLAFAYLETEVGHGRIQYYGISSNTFPVPASDPKFTSLANVWAIAGEMGHRLTRINTDKAEEESAPSAKSVDSASDHHFRVVQMPLNLLETGAVTEQNQPDGQPRLTLVYGWRSSSTTKSCPPSTQTAKPKSSCKNIYRWV